MEGRNLKNNISGRTTGFYSPFTGGEKAISLFIILGKYADKLKGWSVKLPGTCEPFKAGDPILPREVVVMPGIGATGCLD